jgi:DNA-binding MarR family transcriptional regulator
MIPSDRLNAAKSASTLQLLFRCARRLDEIAVAEVRVRHGLPGLRRAHTALLPHIDLDGTRPTEIAKRVGVSKQAVGELLDEMVAMGMVERVRDPSDGRAVLVRFVGGVEGLLAGIAVLRELEADLAAQVGPARLAALHDALAAISGLVDGPWADRGVAPE